MQITNVTQTTAQTAQTGGSVGTAAQSDAADFASLLFPQGTKGQAAAGAQGELSAADADVGTGVGGESGRPSARQQEAAAQLVLQMMGLPFFTQTAAPTGAAPAQNAAAQGGMVVSGTVVPAGDGPAFAMQAACSGRLTSSAPADISATAPGEQGGQAFSAPAAPQAAQTAPVKAAVLQTPPTQTVAAAPADRTAAQGIAAQSGTPVPATAAQSGQTAPAAAVIAQTAAAPTAAPAVSATAQGVSAVPAAMTITKTAIASAVAPAVPTTAPIEPVVPAAATIARPVFAPAGIAATQSAQVAPAPAGVIPVQDAAAQGGQTVPPDTGAVQTALPQPLVLPSAASAPPAAVFTQAAPDARPMQTDGSAQAAVSGIGAASAAGADGTPDTSDSGNRTGPHDGQSAKSALPGRTDVQPMGQAVSTEPVFRLTEPTQAGPSAGAGAAAQVADAVKTAFAAQRSELRVRLSPEDLGGITIKLVSQGGALTVSIVADSHHTGQMLAAGLESLKGAMQSSGVPVEKTVVSCAQPDAAGQNAYQQSSRNPHPRRQGRQPRQERQDAGDTQTPAFASFVNITV